MYSLSEWYLWYSKRRLCCVQMMRTDASLMYQSCLPHLQHVFTVMYTVKSWSLVLSMSAILDFKVTVTLNGKNNPGNGFLIPKLVGKEVLHNMHVWRQNGPKKLLNHDYWLSSMSAILDFKVTVTLNCQNNPNNGYLISQLVEKVAFLNCNMFSLWFMLLNHDYWCCQCRPYWISRSPWPWMAKITPEMDSSYQS